MKYIVTMIALLVFATPIAFASGGPSFEQLYKNSQKEKRVVELIDKSNKERAELKICLRNIAQNKVEKRVC